MSIKKEAQMKHLLNNHVHKICDFQDKIEKRRSLRF